MLLIAGAALALAGCGSSYTRHDFTRRADGICLSTTRALRTLPVPQFSGSAAAQRSSTGSYLTHVGAVVQAESRHLASLQKPPADRSTRRLLTKWLAAVRASGDELAELGSAVRSGNSPAVAQVSRALARLPVVGSARRYGASACAGPGASYAHLPSVG